MKILVVEDNPDSRKLVEDILGAMSYEVVAASNGLQGLEAAQREVPDLIILDVNMPGLSGFEVLEHLKADEQLNSIPILMLTAQGDVDDRVRGLGLGADDYLLKPFNPRELIARVDARLRAKQASDELRAARDQILKTFARYVAPTVVEQLLADPVSVELGGRLQEVTALFADLEGFTALAEHIEPEKVIEILNGYLSLVADAVIENHGTLDKFMGDGVMAIFNAPLPQEDHALQAVTTAFDVHRRVQAYHERLAPQNRLFYRIGISSGPAVVGNVGSAEIRDYTAIGDTINTASRLEQTGEAGYVIISASTYELVRDYVEVEQLGERNVKNKTEPVMVYKVINVELP
ncbi:MAG: response regulator [Chloroflexi bacterium]|nr:response regulator [Chloroflexota bacterium]